MDTETFTISTDSQQLMGLIINTFYQNKDIFLRELISNASDALEKIKLLSQTNPNQAGMLIEPNLNIKVIPNKKTNTLIIQDTGIGMTRTELINNLGTVARSSTKQFVEASSERDINLIGQFGVGFYSCFLVADKVSVISRTVGGKQFRWESSSACSTFTIQQDEDNIIQLTRGSAIILQLNQENLNFLEEQRIIKVIKKYCEFIGFPIELEVDKKKKNENGIEVRVFEQINLNKPLWTKNSKVVTKEEYADFYQQLTNDKEGYLHVKQFYVEGNLEWKAILFIPNKAPNELFQHNMKRNNIKLYVRKVFIMEDCNELIPEYLGFVQGILDFDDLPLNISRDTLQQNKIFKVIKRIIVRKCVEMIAEISDNPENYKRFYQKYSKYLKLGIIEDPTNTTKLSKFLQFYTSMSGENPIYLKEYVTRMKQEQTEIFFIIGYSKDSLNKSLFVEALKQINYEIIYMFDPIDEYVIQHLKEYDGKVFKSCTKELYLDINEDEKKFEVDSIKFEYLCHIIMKILCGQVKKVQIGKRLGHNPCSLVNQEYGWSANMERIMKAQILRDKSMDNYMISKKILEINPNHSIFIELQKISSKNGKIDKNFKHLIWILYETSLLVSGYSLTEPALYVKTIHKMMALSLSIDGYQSEETENKSCQTNVCRMGEID